MSAESMIMIITLGSASMSIVFLLSVLNPSQPDAKKLTKILGEENVKKCQNAKDEEELKTIIRSLTKKQKTKLKTLAESQDIRDAVSMIQEHLLKDNK
ncbi:MAG: 4-hydroxy-3-methylbut-2-en-1-yl diphosphate synthase [Epsilonproteobacteria bacterium]|nr:4-hydroxy-3-methylbut-2-en-1-yl diphosphate synthase [Campylobacterota bacterium]